MVTMKKKNETYMGVYMYCKKKEDQFPRNIDHEKFLSVLFRIEACIWNNNNHTELEVGIKKCDDQFSQNIGHKKK